jgi:hypothetical protein
MQIFSKCLLYINLVSLLQFEMIFYEEKMLRYVGYLLKKLMKMSK